ncbi:MAG: cyclic nucleotide-binding domain-containing protein [Acidobacteria bacterium]|nr:cyclic nucleotide-binding domain-containing protein [Acidobacteriota bacterium]
MSQPSPPRLDLNDIGPYTRTCKAGEPVFAQGDDSSDLYVIDEGTIELLVDGALVEQLGPGDVFGGHSFFHRVVRDVTARATAPARLFRLDRAAFDQVIAEAPEIGVLMLARQARDPRVAPGVPAAAEPAPTSWQARLEITDGTMIALPDLDVIAVGRVDPRAGITPDVDLTPVDPEKTVGRRHARLVRRDGALFVAEDKPTANGTFVDDVRVEPAQEVEVHEGAALRFGRVETVFRRV